MAFYDNTAQPQQRRTVIAAIIDAVAQAIQYRFGQQTGAQRQHIALELVAHHAGDHLGHALDGFKHYIPDEPIANHHIDRALADIVALDVAVEIQADRKSTRTNSSP